MLAERQPLATVQDDADLGDFGSERFMPGNQGLRDRQRVRGNRHIDVRIRKTLPVGFRALDNNLRIARRRNGDVRLIGERGRHFEQESICHRTTSPFEHAEFDARGAALPSLPSFFILRCKTPHRRFLYQA